MKEQRTELCNAGDNTALYHHQVTSKGRKSRDCNFTDHRLVIERESLHGAEGAGGTGYVSKHHESLAPHFQRLQSNNVQNLAKL